MTRRLRLALAIPVAIGLVSVAGALHTPTVHLMAAASTPPAPPPTVPTPIGPPPPPPTFTPTPAPPTATPAPTSTPSAPLGAPARIVARATVQRQGNLAVLHWRMAFQLGIKGFRIYAGHKLLTHSLIRPHHSPNYTARVPWVRGSRYSLLVLFKNGHSQRVAIH